LLRKAATLRWFGLAAPRLFCFRLAVSSKAMPPKQEHFVSDARPVGIRDCIALRGAERVTPATPHGCPAAADGYSAPFAAAGVHPITGLFVDPDTRQLLVRLSLTAADSGADVSVGHQLLSLEQCKDRHPQLLIDYLLASSVYADPLADVVSPPVAAKRERSPSQTVSESADRKKPGRTR
jgi:hypothetical protein